MTDPALIDAAGLAQMLSCSRRHIANLDASGRLPLAIRLGSRCKRWRVDEIQAWILADCPSRDRWNVMRETDR